MATVDLMEEDSTESFVDIMEYDETVQEEEKLLQESQTEQVQVNSDQKLDISPDTTRNYETDVTQKNEDLVYREKVSHKPTEPSKNTDNEEALEANTEEDSSNKVEHKLSETLGPEEDSEQGIPCNSGTEVTQKNEDLSYQEKEFQEPTEPRKNTDKEEPLETNTEENYPVEDSNKVQHEPSETLGPEEDSEQDIPSNHDPEMTLEGNLETQTISVGCGSPQETTYEGSKDEEPKEAVSDKPELHKPQGDKVEDNPKEGNGQEATCGEESQHVHTEKTMADSQDAKEAKKEEEPKTPTDKVMYEESPKGKDSGPDDDLAEQERTSREDQEQPGKTRVSRCKEQPLEIPRLETEDLKPHAGPLLGRDRSEPLWTSQMGGVVALRMEETGPASLCPVTVSQFFSEAVKKHGQKVALCARAADTWKGITYSQYEQQSRVVARGLLKLGLERFHAVLILGFNSPEWFMGEVGAILAGGVAVGVDPLSTAAFCLKVALDSQAQIVLLEDHKQLKKILQIKDKLPNLEAIIQWRGQVEEPCPCSYTWNQLVNLGEELDESYLDLVIATQKPYQCCAVMYSAVDGGEARGTMISHDNITWTSWTLQEMLGLGSEEVVVSYLPLSRMSVQLFDLWLPLSCGGTTYFGESDAQKGSLVSTLCDVQPTLFLGFPGLWEKVNKRWMLVEKKASWLQKRTIRWARKKGLLSYTSSGSLPWGHGLAEHLVFRPARMALGLDRCTLCYVGTEPISPEVAEYFRSFGIDLLEFYGRNETSGVQSIMLPRSRRMASLELVGCRSRGDQDGLHLWGRHIGLGYLGMEQVSCEVFTKDGWFITGN